MKISEYLHFSTGRCCIVFEENRNSLNIQNGGLKIEIKTIKYKTRRKYGPIFMKISGYLYFSASRCCMSFGENCKSLCIQNGGPKWPLD